MPFESNDPSQVLASTKMTQLLGIQHVDPFAVDEPSELSDWQIPLSFMKSRHSSVADSKDSKISNDSWRVKDRMKTWSVALVLCLNIGVDPPDIVKTSPCARKECWIDPLSMSPQKGLELIGSNLQKQYERWQPRARYKQLLDPTTEEVRKLCLALRKNAKYERVLFHYNGHGVPKPTQNGEIWVFNKNYTQYIPLSVYDLQAWMGSPSIYIYDCSHAGLVLESFKSFSRQRDSEFFLESSAVTTNVGLLEKSIQLASCGPKELLPMNPVLPADLFTSCLTTPIKMALLWHCYHRIGHLNLVSGISPEMIDKIPGRLNDRRTPLGELNWIFTAITDTIAWNTMPRGLFQKLFRQDLLVASLFRNFLLAERIMRSYNCTPISYPSLPACYHHPMWQAWDLALDHILGQLPALLEEKVTYQPSHFFSQQLAAFQVWLLNCSDVKQPPAQLPIVLQFLLSQAHRLQALELLGRFLDLGPWAVNLALSVGIFPYVLKLLGSKLKELQPILVFIWAKILAVDPSCQNDLVKDGGYKYFIQILSDHSMQYEYRTMAAFVLSMLVDDYSKGQEVCLQSNVVSLCLSQLEEPNPLLKQWLAVCLGKLWQKYDSAKWCGVRDSAHEKLQSLLWHDLPDVRAAAVFALGTYILNTAEDGSRTEQATSIDQAIAVRLLQLLTDGSPIVRQELVSALHGLVLLYEKEFQIAALRNTESERAGVGNVSTSVTATGWIHVSIEPSELDSSLEKTSSLHQLKNSRAQTKSQSPPAASPGSHNGDRFFDSFAAKNPVNSFMPSSPQPLNSISDKTFYTQVWKGMIFLASDPNPSVAQMAQHVVHSVHDKLRQKSHARNIGVTHASSVTSLLSTKDTSVAKSATLGPSRVRYPSSRRALSPSSPHDDYRGHPLISITQGHVAGTSVPLNRKGNGRFDEMDGDDDFSASRRDLQALPTDFCDWCCKYFANPLTKQPEDSDPASPGYQAREYRFIRNHITRQESSRLCSTHSKCKLSDQVFVNKVEKTPQLLKFHPYTSHLAVMHKSDWSVWDIEDGTKLVAQYNSPARITAAEFLNPHDISFLLTGSDDGAVHVWRDYDSDHPSLVTAWRALTDMLPASKSAGMVLEWEQATRLLYAAGDVRHIRVWDTDKELNIQDIPTHADSCVSCLTSDSADRSLLVAGCGDGTVRLYDRRMPPTSSLVHTLRDHKSWIINVYMQKFNADRNIVTCSAGGDVKIWDPRFTQPVKSISGLPSSVNVCEVHPQAPLLACASPQQAIRVYNLETEEMLNHIRYHDGFMGQKIGPTKCLAFHPHKVWLAAGGTDGLIAIYSTERRK